MADYFCYPLWDSAAAEYNIDPAGLGLSAALQADLDSWGDRFDATLDQDYPQGSGFADTAAAQQWLHDGATLADRLRAELPAPDWEIVYFHATETAAANVAKAWLPPG